MLVDLELECFISDSGWNSRCTHTYCVNKQPEPRQTNYTLFVFLQGFRSLAESAKTMCVMWTRFLSSLEKLQTCSLACFRKHRFRQGFLVARVTSPNIWKDFTVAGVEWSVKCPPCSRWGCPSHARSCWNDPSNPLIALRNSREPVFQRTVVSECN